MKTPSARDRRPDGRDSAATAAEGAPVATDDAALKEALGNRIRELRLARSMSGRALGDELGVSTGFISQIETGNAAPSVSTLVKIAAALRVNVGDLFEAKHPASPVVRRAERPGYTYPELGVREEVLYADDQVEATILKFEPGATSGDELYTMEYEIEVVYVLRGEFTSLLGDETYDLAEGDCLTFAGRTPHGFRCSSDQGAELIVFSLAESPGVNRVLRGGR